MVQPKAYDYTRYLTAKRIIDARSLNRRVWERFLDAAYAMDGALRILEVGAGIGSTAERILSAIQGADIHYTLVDVSRTNVALARQNLARWARAAGYACQRQDEVLHLQRADQECVVECITADLFNFVTETDAQWNVLVAQAFLDLVNLRAALEHVRPRLAPAAVLYLPIHFDGLTAFEPADDPALNRRILQAYHDTMDERTTAYGPSGGSRTGRALMLELRTLEAAILAAGSSDWVVAAGPDGFSSQEQYFLHHMLHFVEMSLTDCGAVDGAELDRWLERRRRQIEDHSLVFIAHQLDVLARFRNP